VKQIKAKIVDVEVSDFYHSIVLSLNCLK